MKLISDSEERKLDSSLLEIFTDYEFTENLEKGRKEIRLQISRYQSELSTDNWGRPLENPLNEIKYLIKKSKNKPERFNPKVKVLFGDNEQHYFINIVKGVNSITQEKGFLLLNEFRSENNESEILKNTLFKSIQEAIQFGYYDMRGIVNQDYKKYIKEKKDQIRKQQKIPRKIIRDFINLCNKSEIDEIITNLDENIIFEKRVNWKTELRIEGVKELEKYIKSQSQELCARDLKIRSSWDFNMPNITIGVIYFPRSVEKEKRVLQEYGRIRFTLNNNKIVSVIEEK